MRALPVKLGDARKVVAEVSLDRESLEWLAGQLPVGDVFTRELYAALRKVDEEIEIIERNTPGITIVLSGTLRDDR